MPPPYKLSATLSGHTQDVRSVASTSGTSGNLARVLSSSRDKTAKLWSTSTSSRAWSCSHTLAGHEGFVNAVCSAVLADGREYAVTGSQDSTIALWDSETGEMSRVLIGHTSNVCALDSKEGLLASASWDMTAKIWDLKDGSGDAKYTLEGADQAVWAVAILPRSSPDQPIQCLTASADKLIRLYEGSKLLRVFKGHEQPVRALALIPPAALGEDCIFASAGNDGLIKIWNWSTGGSELSTLQGHDSFVYSLAVTSDGTLVSSGEDRTVRLWDKLTGALQQVITIPAISIWSVAILSGSDDIIVGSSDSLVRIFTADSSRHASSEELATFDQAVSSSAINASQVVGDIRKSDLKDESSLLSRQGTKEGEIAMVKNASGGVEAHQWDAAQRKWTKVGEVVDAVGSGRKQLYEGQEYDYVFDVDVHEGQPPLKLPYNVTQNPYEAAQKFLLKYDLPQSYIDQVVQFIEKNTGGATLGTQGNSDPYTGGSSYRSSGPPAPAAAPSSGWSGDPWSNSASAPSPAKAKLLPHKTYLNFAQANVTAITKKLLDLNKQLSDDPTTATESALLSSDVTTLQSLAASLQSSPSTFELDTASLTVLERLLDWPPSSRFPALDLIRVISLQTSSTSPLLFPLLSNLSPSPTATPKEQETNSMLASRAIANMFAKDGAQKMKESAPEALETLSVAGTSGINKLGKTALATVALNYSILAVNGDLTPESVAFLVDFIEHLLQETESETVYRALVALGNVAFSPEAVKGSLSVGKLQSLKSRATALASGGEQRIKDIVAELSSRM